MARCVMAGLKGRSGRKSESEIAEVRRLIDKAMTEKKWLAVINRLANSKQPRAIELLFRYRFGPPPEPEASVESAPQFVHFYLPAANPLEAALAEPLPAGVTS